jgi:hypothetical protein
VTQLRGRLTGFAALFVLRSNETRTRQVYTSNLPRCEAEKTVRHEMEHNYFIS